MSQKYPYYSIYSVECGQISKTNSYRLTESRESEEFLETKAREFADKTGKAHLILIFRGPYSSDLVEVVWPGGLYKWKIQG